MKKTIAIVCLLLVATVFTIGNNSFAVTHQNSVSARNINVRGTKCNIRKIEVKYKFSTLMGEATSNYSFRWVPQSGTEEDCLPSGTVIYLKAKSPDGNYKSYIRLSQMTMPKGNWSWAYNTTGSPSWNHFFCGTGRIKDKCYPKEIAKDFFKLNLRISFDVIQNEGSEIVEQDANRSCNSQPGCVCNDGLMWQAGHIDKYLNKDAKNYCDRLNLCGYTDWRLPNCETEFLAAKDFLFKNFDVDPYWALDDSNGFWRYFYIDRCGTYNKNDQIKWRNDSYNTRCVRD